MAENTSPVAIVITHDEARLWLEGLEPGDEARRVNIEPRRRDVRHGRKTDRHQGYVVDLQETALFDEVASAAHAAKAVILLGHGTGKSSAMHAMLEHWRAKAPDLAERVLVTLEVNLNAMSDAQLLAAAREWWLAHREFIE